MQSHKFEKIAREYQKSILTVVYTMMHSHAEEFDKIHVQRLSLQDLRKSDLLSLSIIVHSLNESLTVSDLAISPFSILIIVACRCTPRSVMVHTCARVIPVVFVNEGKDATIFSCSFCWTIDSCDKSIFL